MSSMGKLMALALLCTVTAAVLFQPALMGPPRKPSGHRPPWGFMAGIDLAWGSNVARCGEKIATTAAV
jgi:hypothetical protein